MTSSFKTVLYCALLRSLLRPRLRKGAVAQSQSAALFCAYTELLLCSPLQSQGEPPSPCLLPLQAFSPSNGAANNNQGTVYANIVKRLFTTWQEEGGSLSSHKSSLCNAIFRGKGTSAAPAFSCRRSPHQFYSILSIFFTSFFNPHSSGAGAEGVRMIALAENHQ